MVDITVAQVSPGTYTFHVKNRTAFESKLQAPVIVEPMPESGYTQAIMTKIEGNTLVITLSFRLLDYTGKVSTLVDELVGGSAILTPMQQYNFLMTTFECKGIQYKYTMTFTDGGITASYAGTIQELTIRQEPENADIWECTIQFAVGNVIAVSS